MATDKPSEQRDPQREGILSFDQIVEMTREEARNVVGVRAWDLARLRQLVNNRLATTPELPPTPPSLFISYRWGTEAHQAWVARLAHDLKARGYDVYFDQDLQANRDEPLPVPELVSLIARCNHLLMVITDGYMERIESKDEKGTLQDGWVWDEYQLGMILAQAGRLKVRMMLWRSGKLPAGIHEDQVWDLRDDDAYHNILAQAFPPRLANLIGMRADGTMRLVGPIERMRLNEIGRRLEAEDHFDHFVIQHL